MATATKTKATKSECPKEIHQREVDKLSQLERKLYDTELEISQVQSEMSTRKVDEELNGEIQKVLDSGDLAGLTDVRSGYEARLRKLNGDTRILRAAIKQLEGNIRVLRINKDRAVCTSLKSEHAALSKKLYESAKRLLVDAKAEKQFRMEKLADEGVKFMSPLVPSAMRQVPIEKLEAYLAENANNYKGEG